MNKPGLHFEVYAMIAVSILCLSTIFSISLCNFTTVVEGTLPAGYHHRPINEFFTSLSCPPCMDGTDQAHDEVWVESEWGQHPDVRYTWVVFHTDVGGANDDPLVTDDGISRCVYYYETPGRYGSPIAEFDGGYRESGSSATPDSIKTDYDESGGHTPEREAEIFVTQEFTDTGIHIEVSVHYIGGDPGVDSTPTIEDIDATLYVFVIEDHIWAYSSDLNDMYLNHNVFREYAIENEEFTLEADEWYTTSADWSWPDPQPQVPMNPGEVSVVAAVYDMEDISSGENNAGAARASSSSSPKATSVDESNPGPSISNMGVIDRASDSVIEADLSDADGISSSWLVYNNSAVEFDWTVEQMNVDTNGYATATITEGNGETIQYYILAYDDQSMEGRTGQLNHTIQLSDDSIPPAQISDLVAEPGAAEGEIDLFWTAPGDDDTTGTASKYIIRHHTSQISSGNWDLAVDVPNTMAPKSIGNAESFSVQSLVPEETYFFAVRAEDEVQNLGAVSNSPSAKAPSNPDDSTAPAKISDLNVEPGSNIGEVDLSWTAPGDDASSGTASKYYIRYSSSKIDSEVEWDAATVVTNSLQPKSAGSQETYTVMDLASGELLYFAIRTEDDVLLLGQISNSPSVTPYAGDTISPGKVTDLTAEPGVNVGEVDLTWTAPGDDGDSGGKASNYILKYSLSDITSQSEWDAATDISGEPAPGNPGSTQTHTISGLTGDTKYYFAIKAEDEVPNLSDISDSANAVAPSLELQPPEITNVYYEPINPIPTDDVTFFATVTGDIKNVKLSICKLNETCSYYIMTNTQSDSYSRELGTLSEGDYEYHIMVTDNQNNPYESEVSYFTVAYTSNGDTDKESGTQWFEEGNNLIMLSLAFLVIIIVAILSMAMSRSKKGKEQASAEAMAMPVQPVGVQTVAVPVAAPMTAEPVFSSFEPVQPATEDISCPSCDTIFSIPLEPRPLQVQCPGCAMRGMID